jgi:hypothetical protein
MKHAHPTLPVPADAIEADFWRELQQIQAEAIGWQPLAPGAYLHAGDPHASTVTVVGVPSLTHAGQAVLLVCP